MDFSLPEDQQLMMDTFARLMCSRNWDTYLHECDEKYEYLLEWAEAICELGFDRILLPEKYDELGADWVTLIAAHEVPGREGGPIYVLYQLSCWGTVLRGDTGGQKEKILPFVGTGEQMLNCAMIEPPAGSSWGDMRIIYTRKDGKVYPNGHETLIIFSLYVLYFMVTARDSENMDIYTRWFVDMSLPGITKELLARLGLRMDSRCDVYLDNVELKEEDLLDEEGSGFRHGMADFDLEHFLVALTSYDTAYCTFEDAAKYANQHIQGGQTAAHHQPIQLKFVEMKVHLTNTCNMLYRIAWKHDSSQLLHDGCSMAKYYCPEVSFEVVDRALQVLVGIGITGNRRIQHFYRDLHVDRISGSTDEMMILTTDHSALYPYR